MELTLRKVEKKDVDFFVKHLNEDKNYPKYLYTPWPYTKKDGLFWVNKCAKEYRKEKPNGYSYIITVDKIPVGAISFNIIDYKNDNAEIGCWLAKEYRGQGIMKKATEMICHIGFKQLKLKRIYSRVSPKNKNSQKLMNACGFKLEGLLRKDKKLNNKYQDTLIYAIVNSKL